MSLISKVFKAESGMLVEHQLEKHFVSMYIITGVMNIFFLNEYRQLIISLYDVMVMVLRILWLYFSLDISPYYWFNSSECWVEMKNNEDMYTLTDSLNSNSMSHYRQACKLYHPEVHMNYILLKPFKNTHKVCS